MARMNIAEKTDVLRMVPSQYLITDALMTSVLTLFLFSGKEKVCIRIFGSGVFLLLQNDKEIKLVGAYRR